jgi:hypothetical protein
MLSHLSEIAKLYSRTVVSWEGTRLFFVRTVGKQSHFAIVALQGALYKLHYLKIPSGTLSNYALCTSWAFVYLPKNISKVQLGVKCIGIFDYFVPAS